MSQRQKQSWILVGFLFPTHGSWRSSTWTSCQRESLFEKWQPPWQRDNSFFKKGLTGLVIHWFSKSVVTQLQENIIKGKTLSLLSFCLISSACEWWSPSIQVSKYPSWKRIEKDKYNTQQWSKKEWNKQVDDVIPFPFIHDILDEIIILFLFSLSNLSLSPKCFQCYPMCSRTRHVTSVCLLLFSISLLFDETNKFSFKKNST